MRFRREGAAGMMLMALPFFLYGAQDPPTISVNVELVVLHVTVRHRDGGFVSGLQKQSFHVFEDGHPQDIRVFQAGDVPVAVGLIVDNSGSMAHKKPDVMAAARAFVRASNPRDQEFVVNFNEHVSLGLPEGQEFSSSPEELAAAINRNPPSGRTALYDAIQKGLARLKKATLDKKVLIVISDGGDNASHHSLQQALEDAEKSDVIIYTVGLFDENQEDTNPGVLKKLARATGGEAYFPNLTADVVPVCEKIAQDIRNQYTIAYAPSNAAMDNSFRKIRVTATGPHGHKYQVRTREGYIAAPHNATGTATREKVQ